MSDDPKSALPRAPRLPQRAAIYITPDGSVKFGALFEGLVPVGEAIGAKSLAALAPTGASLRLLHAERDPGCPREYGDSLLDVIEGGRRPRLAPIASRGIDTEA